MFKAHAPKKRKGTAREFLARFGMTPELLKEQRHARARRGRSESRG